MPKPSRGKKQARVTIPSWPMLFWGWLKERAGRVKLRVSAFLKRRPHRSFRRTRRRDYVRPLPLPGVFSFTHEVSKTVWGYRRFFLPLVVIYAVLYAVLVGLFSQESYNTLADTLKETGSEVFSGNWGTVGQAGLLLISVVATGSASGATELQQGFAVLLALFAWLTVVWLLRNRMAGHKVSLRDAIYSSGAPLFATMLIALCILIQLLPIALAVIGYAAAASTGVLAGGAPTMLFWLAAGGLVVLSLYWVTSSLFALVVVTLPGTYPLQAIKAAGDLMVGRRVKILGRWLWMLLVGGGTALLVMLPIVLLDMWLKSLVPGLSWLPLVPVVLVFISGAVSVWVSAYIYLLYRKVVDYVPAK